MNTDHDQPTDESLADPELDDVDEPFDHGGCFQPHVRGGEYYDCDGRPL
ncbi:hypothetical protein [Kitasatospora aureofaciens]